MVKHVRKTSFQLLNRSERAEGIIHIASRDGVEFCSSAIVRPTSAPVILFQILHSHRMGSVTHTSSIFVIGIGRLVIALPWPSEMRTHAPHLFGMINDGLGNWFETSQFVASLKPPHLVVPQEDG